MRARNEGAWGNLLQVSLSFNTSPIAFVGATATQMVFDENSESVAGSLLRLTLPGGSRVLRFISNLVLEPRTDGAGKQITGMHTTPVSGASDSAELVTGTLDVDDGDSRTEEHTALGLSSSHPRWIATVLCNESELLFPDASWIDADINPDSVGLNSILCRTTLQRTHRVEAKDDQFQDGEDGWAVMTPDDYFDPEWTVDNEDPGQGMQFLAQLSDLSVVVAPDVYSPAPLDPIENILDPISLAGPEFETCVDIAPGPQQGQASYDLPGPQQGQASYDLAGLRLDPRDPADLDQITSLQEQLVAFAEAVQIGRASCRERV